MPSTKHKWNKLPDSKEPNEPSQKNWECVKCGCKKFQENSPFGSVGYVRSGCFYLGAPLCTPMGRTCNEPLD